MRAAEGEIQNGLSTLAPCSLPPCFFSQAIAALAITPCYIWVDFSQL